MDTVQRDMYEYNAREGTILNQTQKIRVGYTVFPHDYYRELKRKGNRTKAIAFMDYFDDGKTETVFSYRFYAKAWGVSHTTAERWVKEFKEEICLFGSHWILKEMQHYTSVQKTMCQESARELPKNTHKMPENTGLQKNDVTAMCQESAKEFNNISSSNSIVNFYDAEFEDMYRACRMSKKQVGKKDEIYIEYQKHKNISCKDMRFAYLFYLNDKKAAKENRYFGLTKFMQNQIYLNYLNLRVHINLDDKEIEGVYDKTKDKLICDDGSFYTLTNERFLELLRQDKIMLIGGKAA
jgi:hypothetical protein